MRCFIAIDMPENVKLKIAEIQEKIKTQLSRACIFKFVEPQNLHLTLKFIGETQQVEALKQALLECKQKFTELSIKKFQAHIAGFGVFPDMKFIRVLWFGLEPEQQFEQLHRIIENCTARHGFKKENRFKAHVTLARVKVVKDKTKLIKIVADLAKTNATNAISFEVNKIKLKQSTLTRHGPIYTDIFEIELE